MEVLPGVEHQDVGRHGGFQPVIVGMVMLTMVKPQGAGKRVGDGAHSKLQALVGVLPGVQHQGAGVGDRDGDGDVKYHKWVGKWLCCGCVARYQIGAKFATSSVTTTSPCSLVFNTGKHSH